jgi:hypothetical protein
MARQHFNPEDIGSMCQYPFTTPHGVRAQETTMRTAVAVKI